MILATRNAGKLREIREILADVPVTIVGLDEHPLGAKVPEIEETGSTLEENALLKARTVFRLTGTPAISDDSGLEVDFLGGAPGVISARYAGPDVTYEDNNRKLLLEMAEAGPDARRARFRCIAAYAGPGGERAIEGICEGRIAMACRGSNGFGYDPLFIPIGYDRTFAELPATVKNGISHRSRAFSGLGAYLRSLYPPASLAPGEFRK